MKKDVVVIGSGPGGYVAAIRCAQRGLDTAVIEKEKIGGVCLNVGCIPTKALFKNASFVKDLKRSDALGVDVGDFTIDFAKMMARKEGIVKQLTGGVKHLLKKNGVTTVTGTAEIIDRNTVSVEAADGTRTEISCDHIIIATGSEPIVPPIPGVELDGVMTSRELLSIQKLPESMAVIGGGVIGMEFASIFSTLGVKVHVIERLPNVLPNLDKEVTDALVKSLTANGVKVMAGTEVTAIADKDGKLTVKTNEGEVTVEKVLLSVGRKPVLPKIAFEGIKVERGAAQVDGHLRTSVDNIYCIGDANGKMQLAHVASAEAIIAADYISKHSDRQMSYKSVPSVVYSLPEVASVGMTEEEARNRGDVKIGRFNYSGNGKALCMNETTGFAKVITGTRYNEILGVHIFGYDASNMIAEAGVAINLEATAEEIAETIHAHPTISEIVMECCEAIEFKSVHA